MLDTVGSELEIRDRNIEEYGYSMPDMDDELLGIINLD